MQDYGKEEPTARNTFMVECQLEPENTKGISIGFLENFTMASLRCYHYYGGQWARILGSMDEYQLRERDIEEWASAVLDNNDQVVTWKWQRIADPVKAYTSEEKASGYYKWQWNSYATAEELGAPEKFDE